MERLGACALKNLTNPCKQGADHVFISSNRESGYGRYDVMLEPKNPRHDDAYILEFKVR